MKIRFRPSIVRPEMLWGEQSDLKVVVAKELVRENRVVKYISHEDVVARSGVRMDCDI